MKNLFSALVITVFTAISAPAVADIRIVTLSVSGMT